MRDNIGQERANGQVHCHREIKEHAPELNAAGIVHLGVHGSVARGDATPSSDVDLIAEFDQAKRLSLIGRSIWKTG